MDGKRLEAIDITHILFTSSPHSPGATTSMSRSGFLGSMLAYRLAEGEALATSDVLNLRLIDDLGFVVHVVVERRRLGTTL